MLYRGARFIELANDVLHLRFVERAARKTKPERMFEFVQRLLNQRRRSAAGARLCDAGEDSLNRFTIGDKRSSSFFGDGMQLTSILAIGDGEMS